MSILIKNRTKKQILKNIEEARSILSKIKKCIIPANNIYWCNQLDLQRSTDDADAFSQFNKNVPTILTLIKEFNDLYHCNSKLCLDCPKQKEFSDDFFVRALKSLYNEVSTTTLGIKKLPNFKTDKDIRKTEKLLEIILDNLKVSLDDILENQELEKGL